MSYLENFEKLNKDCWIYKDIVSADISNVRKSLGIILINYDMNAEALMTIPHQRFFDLAIVPSWKYKNGLSEEIIILSNNLCDAWEISADELLKMAIKYAPESSAFWLMEMGEYLSKIDPDTQGSDECPFYILSNKEMDYGASALCYEGALEDIYREIGYNYYIIPANVHHMLLVPDIFSINHILYAYYSVNQVNLCTLSMEEYLSNRMYYYDHSTGDVIMVDHNNLLYKSDVL